MRSRSAGRLISKSQRASDDSTIATANPPRIAPEPTRPRRHNQVTTTTIGIESNAFL